MYPKVQSITQSNPSNLVFILYWSRCAFLE